MPRSSLSPRSLPFVAVALALGATICAMPLQARAQDAGQPAADAGSTLTAAAGSPGSDASAPASATVAASDAGRVAPSPARPDEPVATAPGDQVETIGPRQSPHAERPGVTVWFAPVYLFYYAFSSSLSLTLGANIPIVRYWEIVAEGTLQLGARASDFLRDAAGARLNLTDPMSTHVYTDPYFGLRGAVGVSHLFGIRGSLMGPFILPKITFGYRSINEARCVPDCSTAGFTVMRRAAAEGDVGIELDAGFQFQARHFFIALIIGVGVGYCINCIVPIDPMHPVAVPQRANQFQPQVNFDALRFGVTF